MKLTSIRIYDPAGANGLPASECPQQSDIDFISVLVSLTGEGAALPGGIGPLPGRRFPGEESGEDNSGEEGEDAPILFQKGVIPGLMPFAAAGTIANAAAMPPQERSADQSASDAPEVPVLIDAYSAVTYEAGMGSYFGPSGLPITTAAAGSQENRSAMTVSVHGAGIPEIDTAYAEAARAAGTAIPVFGTGQPGLPTAIPASGSDISGNETLPVQAERVLQHDAGMTLNSAATAAQPQIDPQGGSPAGSGSIRTAAGPLTESYRARRTISSPDETRTAIDSIGLEAEAGAMPEAKDSFPDTVKALYESSVSQARRTIRSDAAQKKPPGDDSGIAGTVTVQLENGMRVLTFSETTDPGNREETGAPLDGSLSQVTQGITDKLASGKSDFVIKLKPEGMGEITVKMAKRDGKIVLSLAVSNPQTEKLLSGEIESLRRSLRAHEAEIDRITGPLPESGANGYTAGHSAFSYTEENSGRWRFPYERSREDPRGHAYAARIDDVSGIEAEAVARRERILLDKYA